jgi:S1-C subfamily serine protease
LNGDVALNRLAALLVVIVAAVLLAVLALGDLILSDLVGRRGTEPIEVADALGATVEPDAHDGGLLVTSVQENGAAIRAGVRVGDIVKRIGKTPVHSLKDAANAIDQSAESVTLTLNRGRQCAKVRLLLMSRPDDSRDRQLMR